MRLIVAIAAAAVAFAAPDSANAQLGQITQAPRAGTLERGPTPRPRFVAEAISFRAYDETGPDWGGSDEVYAVFQDSSGQHRFTQTFGNVDSGDTETISRRQRCVAPIEYAGYDSNGFPPAAWRCQTPGAAGDLEFSITLYEEDGWSPIACAAAPGQPAYKKNCDDNAITTFQQRFTARAMLTLMPNVGDAHVVTTPTRGGYAFTFRLRRLPDAFDPPTVLQ